ncbi:unnamed protein product, partial [Discosporangium mesarthrocarpum]
NAHRFQGKPNIEPARLWAATLFTSPAISMDVQGVLQGGEVFGGGASVRVPGQAVDERQFQSKGEVIRQTLLNATEVLSAHGLKLATKWAAEQLVGLPDPPENLSDNPCHGLGGNGAGAGAGADPGSLGGPGAGTGRGTYSGLDSP